MSRLQQQGREVGLARGEGDRFAVVGQDERGFVLVGGEVGGAEGGGRAGRYEDDLLHALRRQRLRFVCRERQPRIGRVHPDGQHAALPGRGIRDLIPVLVRHAIDGRGRAGRCTGLWLVLNDLLWSVIFHIRAGCVIFESPVFRQPGGIRLNFCAVDRDLLTSFVLTFLSAVADPGTCTFIAPVVLVVLGTALRFYLCVAGDRDTAAGASASAANPGTAIAAGSFQLTVVILIVDSQRAAVAFIQTGRF